MRGGRGAAERTLRRRRVEQVAFQIGHRRIGHQRLGHIRLVEADAGAEIGVHRALPIRRHHDQAARGGRAAVQRRRGEVHADRGHVVAEHGAQLIVRHLAEIGDARARAPPPPRRCSPPIRRCSPGPAAWRHTAPRPHRRRSASSSLCACRGATGTCRPPAPPHRRWRCRCRECRSVWSCCGLQCDWEEAVIWNHGCTRMNTDDRMCLSVFIRVHPSVQWLPLPRRMRAYRRLVHLDAPARPFRDDQFAVLDRRRVEEQLVAP